LYILSLVALYFFSKLSPLTRILVTLIECS